MSTSNAKSWVSNNLLGKLKGSHNYKDVIFAMGIISIIAVLIFPIPTTLLDLLLSISITCSVLVLMTVLFINKPLDFSSFPSVLLVVTMLRLALNISTTRLILSGGHLGTSAAGHVVEAFGYFIMQGSVVIGAIIFGILTIINFIVITKGSGRIAEVAARFSLDAMPGKQMAVDADLSAGLIDETLAKTRRKQIEDENTFFGAMDGANKFVRGDAIAGLLITFINLIGGIVIGVVQMNMSFDQALHTYTILTIGDGLVSQIPALIVSTSAGLLVTKSGVDGSTEKAIFEQLGRYPQAMAVSSGLMVFMSVMPGIPMVPFLFSALITGATGYFINQAHKQTVGQESSATPSATGESKTGSEAAGSDSGASTSSLHMDSVRLELGYELLQLLNNQKGYKITDQIKALRKQIAKELGFILPSVRIQDNMQLDPNAYVLKIKDIECGRGQVKPNMILVMEPRGKKITIPGEDTIEPAFGLPARWVAESSREEALFKEYTVVEPTTVITTHLTEIVKENITELLSYSETQKLLDSLPQEHQKLAEEVVPNQITVIKLQRILQKLLSENVSIRDLPTILEGVSEVSGSISDVNRLVEHVRATLAKQICYSNMTEESYLPIVILSPKWEQAFMENITGEEESKRLSMAPSMLQEFINALSKELEKQAAAGEVPVILTAPKTRYFVRSVIERYRPSLVVMSQNEIHPKIKIKTLGQI